MPVVQIAVCQTILQSAIPGGYGIRPYGDNTVGRYALGAPGMTICYAHVYIIKTIPFQSVFENSTQLCYFNKIMAEARNAKLKKFLDNLSYRVAMCLNCLSLLKKHSTRWRSLY